MVPVAGLVSSRAFLSNLGEGSFLSTQYIRHASQPLYTPEPDVVHELVGHACTLFDPDAGAPQPPLRRGGRARRTTTRWHALERIYWYTDGVRPRRRGRAELPKAYGAGLLSSFGELERFDAAAEIRPFDPDEAAARPYDPTTYQAVLYRVADFAVARAGRARLARPAARRD